MKVTKHNPDAFDKVVHELMAEKKVHQALCEMCPNTEFFLVRIFPHLD